MLARAEGDMVAGRYRMEELVGRGGMGEVWRAHDELLERQVAVKFARLEDIGATGRLRKEAQNAARLHHPNIVGVFDLVEEDATCLIVMEFVAARSLAQIMAERGPLSPAEAGAIGCQIADALAASHAERVVHGDVTPENVLVQDDGIAKLTDFGISRALWSDPTFDGSHTMSVHGKPRYLAPEVAGGHRSDRQSDMFSLGATLYAAVEGRSPYGEVEHPVAYLSRAQRGHIEQPRRAGPLTQALTALLEVDPRRRPGAVQARKMLRNVAPPPPEVQERLRDGQTMHGMPFTMRLLPQRARRLTPWPLRPPHGPRLRVAAAIAAVLAAAAVVSVIVVDPWGGGGGGGDVAGKSGPGGGRVGAPGTTPAVVGPVRTADPCGLLDTTSFTPFGTPNKDVDYGELDRCDILIQPNADGPETADVNLNFASDPGEPDSQARTRKAGAVTVVELPEDGGACERDLRLADGNEVLITAKSLDKGAPDLCTLADTAVRYATSVLNRGPVPRRPAGFPPNSLARRDACALLDATALKVIPGIDARNPDHSFANWGCSWNSPTSDAGVELFFNRDDSLKDDDGLTPKRLGGTESYVGPEYDGDHSCTVLTVNRTYTDSAGDTTIEYVDLIAHGPEAVAKLCDTAEKLGTAVARNLQKP